MPTATISAANIQDNWITETSGDTNRGASVSLETRHAAGHYRILLRAASAAMPAGTIVAARLKMYCWYVSTGDTVTAYRIAAANTWVQGTQNAATEVGSSCWNYAKYNTQAWAGSAGCSTVTTDYLTGDGEPSCAISATGWATWNLPGAWIAAWRDTPAENNGVILSGSSGDELAYHSVEYATDTAKRPYLEIDYSLGGPSATILRPSSLSHRRIIGG